VDLVGYISLFHVFVANMTGNTVALGEGWVESNWGLALRRGSAIPFFVAGMLVSRISIHLARQKRWPYVYALLHAFQLLLLMAFVILGHGLVRQGQIVATHESMDFVLIACLSMAMGVQNASARHFGALSIHTTHVTGTLAKFADETAQFVLRARGPLRDKKRRGATLLGLLWLFYFLGVTSGAVFKQEWELNCLVLPIAFLLALVLSEIFKPRLWSPTLLPSS
jgi:uncharacterized membrane protein YoaK (UPF0700 family)